MMNGPITLLYGGKSPEHLISCISAAAVHRELTRAGFSVLCIGIARDCSMYLQKPQRSADPLAGTDRLDIICEESRRISIVPGEGLRCAGSLIDAGVLFPLTHGAYGEDGRLQGLLDYLPLPYIGCGFSSSFLGFSKYAAKLIWQNQGLPVVPWITCTAPDAQTRRNLLDEVSDFGLPVFVKPDTSGSSIGVSRAERIEEVIPALLSALLYSERALIERAITAREIECSVFPLKSGISVSEPGEIISSHTFYDFAHKYQKERAQTAITVPAALSAELKRRARALARDGYQALCCRGLARVDMLLDTADGTLYLNEVNTIPGFTETSMFMQLVSASGFSWHLFIEEQVQAALHAAAQRREELRG
jgi:D-alanine-D-alanine ligase